MGVVTIDFLLRDPKASVTNGIAQTLRGIAELFEAVGNATGDRHQSEPPTIDLGLGAAGTRCSSEATPAQFAGPLDRSMWSQGEQPKSTTLGGTKANQNESVQACPSEAVSGIAGNEVLAGARQRPAKANFKGSKSKKRVRK